jgi:hypothetical protein
MNTLCASALGLLGALALAGTAFAQVPSSNDTSDAFGNTGMGTNALFSVTPSGNCNSNIFAGTCNTASGYQALYSNTAGNWNTAFGYQALYSNTGNSSGGYENTASGSYALYSNTTGSYNTASGFEALYSNTTGGYNTASGAVSLYFNTSGIQNTASGSAALAGNTTGNNNTATGYAALNFNTTGSNNTASGVDALYSNTTADYNTASGYGALYSNNGVSNTASGYEALYANKTGTENTASGVHALASNTTGSNNIAEGYHGGYNLTTGSNNIDIGSPGVKADSGVIRIGTITGTTSTQSAAYIAGIYGVKTATAGTAVFIDSSGQLGTVSSSIRYKEDVQPMAGASERLQRLRPVKFRYKKADSSGEKPIQYGLIAEEVAKVYPELVVRDTTTGRIDGVRYDELAPMLLNEAQRQQQKIAAQAAEIRDLKQQQKQLTTRIAQLSDVQKQMAEVRSALTKLQAADQSVVQR